MSRKKIRLKNSGGIVVVILLLSIGLFGYHRTVNAVDSNVSNGIVVDSILDGVDANTSDSICDDGFGNCTLRAAIQEANNTPGADFISFNIPGSGVRTIQPESALPDIVETVTIDGYTQPGATVNTAVAPQPMNGTLLIELDGTNAGSSVDGITISPSAEGVTLRGLVINRFSFRGIGGNGSGSGTVLHGNYIGTDPSGLIDRGNADQGVQIGPDARIGGTSPEERNIISGNDGGGASPNIGDNNWVVKGNYIGLGADGMTAISNSPVGGTGAMSIDNSTGHIIGGTEVGATNVISGNRSFGLFPDNVSNVTIQGNIIGPNWKGDPIPDNPQLGGIGLPPLAGSMFSILIGGTTTGASNLIAHNNGTGVAVLSVKEAGITTLTSTNISILGNRIFGNQANVSYPLSKSGIGIDLAILNKDVDNLYNSTITEDGPTLNDTTDSDSGPNGYINYPVPKKAIKSGNNLDISFDLDAADSTDDTYRVEFFASDSADPSDHGEGQIFLGASVVTTGVNKQASITLPQNLDLAGKVLSATTTAINNTTPSGFGPTSEFSPVVSVSVLSAKEVATVSSGGLADTGVGIVVVVIMVVVLIVSIVCIYVDYKKHKKPLQVIDPHVAYSFPHFLKVVTFPLFRYRISIKLSKINPLGNKVRKF